MFFPSLIPENVHQLWLEDDDVDSKYLIQRRAPSQGAPQSFYQRSNRKIASSFQPPSAPSLSSYSSACVGATISTSPSWEIFSNEVESRLQSLESIKTYGYSTLAPLGIGKTMQEINEERNSELQDHGHTEFAESMVDTAENVLQDSNTGNNLNNGVFQDPDEDFRLRTNSLTRPQDEGTGFTNSRQEHDLDADIPDAREYEENIYLDDVLDEANDVVDDEDNYADEEFMVGEEYEEDDDNDDANETRPEFEMSTGNTRGESSAIGHGLMRPSGTRNISTSTRISSLNPELQEQLDRLDLPEERVVISAPATTITGHNLSNNSSLRIDSQMYSNSFSMNTSHQEVSDMEVE